MRTSFRSRHVLVLVATTVALTLSQSTFPDENPLHAHRDKAARQAFDSIQLNGVVVQTVGDDQLVLSIPPSQLKSISFDEGDHARIEVGAQ